MIEYENEQKAEEQINKINSLTDYIMTEYINAGGTKESASRDITFGALLGILEHEGEVALDEFISNWEPYITKLKTVGYAGI